MLIYESVGPGVEVGYALVNVPEIDVNYKDQMIIGDVIMRVYYHEGYNAYPFKGRVEMRFMEGQS